MKYKPTMPLENWKLVYPSECDAVMSPEAMKYATRLCLLGDVDQHHTLDCSRNKKIRTSRIVAVDGCLVRTYRGSFYFLGKPAPEFAEKARHYYPDWNEDAPLSMLPSHIGKNSCDVPVYEEDQECNFGPSR